MKTCQYPHVRPMVDLVVSTTESMRLEQKLKILLLLLSPHIIELAPVATGLPTQSVPKDLGRGVMQNPCPESSSPSTFLVYSAPHSLLIDLLVFTLEQSLLVLSIQASRLTKT